jgi:iron-sulfur cluster assembly accessory protein
MADLMQQQDTDLETPALTVTPVAAAKIMELLQARNIPGYALRIFVAGGGCSGLQYGMAFEERPQESDTVVETDGVRLIVDPTSVMYIGGATVDFIDSLMGGGFRIDNPNAVATCGCGQSFRTTGKKSARSSTGCNSCS